MNKILFGVVVIALIVIAGFYFVNTMDSSVTGNVIRDNTERETKTFMVIGDGLRFFIDGVENPDIVVNEGDQVEIIFQSTDGFHDWVVDEFNASTKKVGFGDGESKAVFYADKKGVFEYYCSVGQHRANGMKGRLIVN